MEAISSSRGALKELYGIPYVVGTPVGRLTSERLAGYIRQAAEAGENRCLFEHAENALQPDSNSLQPRAMSRILNTCPRVVSSLPDAPVPLTSAERKNLGSTTWEEAT